jgi:hypothetical protein
LQTPDEAMLSSSSGARTHSSVGEKDESHPLNCPGLKVKNSANGTGIPEGRSPMPFCAHNSASISLFWGAGVVRDLSQFVRLAVLMPSRAAKDLQSMPKKARITRIWVLLLTIMPVSPLGCLRGGIY